MSLGGPCNWPHSGCPSCGDDGLGCLNPAQQDEVIAWAKSDLWEATGRVYGTCEASVLVCNDSRILCGTCYHAFRQCGCRSVSEVWLPGPVHSVSEVVIDGVALDDTAYRIDDYEWLVRIDGGTWPSNSDPTDPDGFRVDYLIGEDPPSGAGMVTGILACERAKAICGDKTCRLPRTMREVSRQGVTMVKGDTGDGIIFGLPEVDQWVTSANSPILAGAVHSPDLPKVRTVTWEAP